MISINDFLMNLVIPGTCIIHVHVNITVQENYEISLRLFKLISTEPITGFIFSKEANSSASESDIGAIS